MASQTSLLDTSRQNEKPYLKTKEEKKVEVSYGTIPEVVPWLSHVGTHTHTHTHNVPGQGLLTISLFNNENEALSIEET